MAPLGWLAEVRLGKMLSPKAFEGDVTILPYLRNENIQWGRVDTSDVKRMGFRRSELARYEVRPGDLLICEGGAAGRCAVYAGPPGTYMYQKALHRVRVLNTALDPYYLETCLRYFVTSGRAIPKTSETTIQHLPLERIVQVLIPVPPEMEMRTIVSEVQRLNSWIEELEGLLDANLRRAARLRQSILTRAFEGKLVPQDPADEPASVLLARIRAERAPESKPRSKLRGQRNRPSSTFEQPQQASAFRTTPPRNR